MGFFGGLLVGDDAYQAVRVIPQQIVVGQCPLAVLGLARVAEGAVLSEEQCALVGRIVVLQDVADALSEEIPVSFQRALRVGVMQVHLERSVKHGDDEVAVVLERHLLATEAQPRYHVHDDWQLRTNVSDDLLTIFV